VENLEKNKLALLPFIVGMAFLFYSWYTSFPLSIEFPGDFVFNHISPFYWLSLPLILGSLYVLGIFSKNHSLRCFAAVAIIATLYSLSYFYFSLSTVDSQLFRGLMEYFMKTKNLSAFQASRAYFEWPSFFLLTDITTTVTGLKLIDFEFFFYATIGFLFTVTLYAHFSRFNRKGAFLAVIAFFISMFWFFNYQVVPFSLALALTFILFMLEDQPKSTPVIGTMLVLFFVVSLTHLFVALFFVLYLFIRTLINRSKQYAMLSLVTVVIYWLPHFVVGSHWLDFYTRSMFSWAPEMGSVVQASLTQALMPIDVIAQTMSRTVTLTVVSLCFLGFVFLLIKRRLRAIDGAMFLDGAAYLAFGFVFYTLGWRALAILFVPVSIGVTYLLETRFKSYLKGLFLVLLILFVFVPLHSSYNSFSDSFIPIQTKEAFNAEHFFMNHYDWLKESLVLAHSPVINYLAPSLDIQQIHSAFESDASPLFPRLSQYDCILYTVGLGNSFLVYNYTIEGIALEEKHNFVYNNGFSSITIKVSNFAVASK
jgi:hypothetical protein